MESNGVKNRIQISNATAELLKQSGKEAWITPREDAVVARGLGILSTYWLTPKGKLASSVASDSQGDSHDSEHIRNIKLEKEIDEERLIAWMVELISTHIRKIMAQRKGKLGTNINARSVTKGKALAEAVDIIVLPKFDAKSSSEKENYRDVVLDPEVIDQLHHFVATVAGMYLDNPFHNFGRYPYCFHLI